MSPDEQEALALRELEACWAAFPLSKRPTVEWSPRLRVSAGVAYWTRGHIKLSRRLLTTPERLRTTLRHEYAHLLAVQRAGRAGAGHGPPWRQAMLDLGLDPVRCHDYETAPPKSGRRVIYECRKCGFRFVRSRRLAQGREYRHRECGGRVRLTEIVTG